MFREAIIMVRIINKVNKSHMVDVDLLDMPFHCTTHRK